MLSALIQGKYFINTILQLGGGRLCVSTGSLGTARPVLYLTVACLAEHKAIGVQIDQFQVNQFHPARMKTDLLVTRIFRRRSAWKMDTNTPNTSMDCAMEKKFIPKPTPGSSNNVCRHKGDTGISLIMGSKNWFATCGSMKPKRESTKSCSRSLFDT